MQGHCSNATSQLPSHPSLCGPVVPKTYSHPNTALRTNRLEITVITLRVGTRITSRRHTGRDLGLFFAFAAHHDLDAAGGGLGGAG